MSGIGGILNLDGAPVDRELLSRMTKFLAYRGPDAQRTWSDGHIGLGHTLLRTTYESKGEKQPCTLDGSVWITADARIDDRENLSRSLEVKGCEQLHRGTATDGELILHAYRVWGEDCVQHLLGDFAFAIWDGGQERLFCARDRFGVKLLYYARVGDCFVFSNTLRCVRIHPRVSKDLNDLAVGDFLLFGFNPEPSTTTFVDIQRLPPAHTLTCSAGQTRITRYWTLPVDGQIRYKQSNDYVDHFKELLGKAVADRLRTDRVAVWMSGGLDSTTIAATACELRKNLSMSLDLQAHCVVYDALIPDRERYYSGLAAQALKIPIHYLIADDYKLFERWDQPELQWPEPGGDPLRARYIDFLKQTATFSRVALNGEGGDALLYPSSVVEMLRGMRFNEVARDVRRYVRSYGRRPPLGLGIYTRLRQWLENGSRHRDPEPYTAWLSTRLILRLAPWSRWDAVITARPNPIHSIRPGAHQALSFPLWLWFLEILEAGVTGVPLEIRLPYLDLRLVNYLMALPPLPWFIDKTLLRTAMREILPRPCLERPKTSLPGDPVFELVRRTGASLLHGFKPAAALSRYFDVEAISKLIGQSSHPGVWRTLLPVCLNYWLSNLDGSN